MPEEKENRGEMTVSEAGHMGGEKGGERSWTASPGTAKTPELDEETRREVQRIREKQARGEELTTHEAGILGGAARVEQAGGGQTQGGQTKGQQR